MAFSNVYLEDLNLSLNSIHNSYQARAMYLYYTLRIIRMLLLYYLKFIDNFKYYL